MDPLLIYVIIFGIIAFWIIPNTIFITYIAAAPWISPNYFYKWFYVKRLSTSIFLTIIIYIFNPIVGLLTLIHDPIYGAD